MALIDLSKYDIGISKNVGTANVGDNSEAAAYGELARFGQTVAGISNELLAKKIDIETSVDANKAEQQFQTEMTKVKLDADSRSENGKIDGVPYAQYMSQKTDELSMRYQDGLGRDLAKRKFQFNNMDYIKNEKVSAVITETKKIQEGVKKGFDDTLKIEAMKNSVAPVGKVVGNILSSVKSMDNIVEAGHKTHYNIGNEMDSVRANTLFEQASHATIINAHTDPASLFDAFEMSGLMFKFQTSEGIDRKRIGQYFIDNKENYAFAQGMDNDALMKLSADIVDDYVSVKGISEKDLVKMSGAINAEYFDKVLSKVDPKKFNSFVDSMLAIRVNMGEGRKVVTKSEANKVAEAFKDFRAPEQLNGLINDLGAKTIGLEPTDADDVYRKAAVNYYEAIHSKKLGLMSDAELEKTFPDAENFYKKLVALNKNNVPGLQEYVDQTYVKLQYGNMQKEIKALSAKYRSMADRDIVKYLNTYDKGAHDLNVNLQKSLITGDPKANTLAKQYSLRVNAMNRARPSTGSGINPVDIFKSMRTVGDHLDKVRNNQGDAAYGKALSNIVNNLPEELRGDAIKAFTSKEEAKAVNYAINMGNTSSNYDIGKVTAEVNLAKQFEDKAQDDMDSKIKKDTITSAVSNIVSDMYGGTFTGQGEIAALHRDSVKSTLETSLKALAMKNPSVSKREFDRLAKEMVDSKFFYVNANAGTMIIPAQEGNTYDKNVMKHGMSNTVKISKESLLKGKYELDLDKMPAFKAYQSRMVNNGKIFDMPALIRQGKIVLGPANNDASGKSNMMWLYLSKDGIYNPIIVKNKGKSEPLGIDAATVYRNAQGDTGWFD